MNASSSSFVPRFPLFPAMPDRTTQYFSVTKSLPACIPHRAPFSAAYDERSFEQIGFGLRFDFGYGAGQSPKPLISILNVQIKALIHLILFQMY
jgi:hypothetical protein